MGEPKLGWQGVIRVVAAIVLAGATAACGTPQNPAPVEMRGLGQPYAGEAPIMRAPGPAAASHQIVVQHGQSLSGIAHAHHMSERAIIAANHLTPPYKVEAGQRLLIPGGTETPMTPALAAASPKPGAEGHPPPEIIPLDGPSPVKSIHPAPETASLSPPPAPAPAPVGPAESSAAEEARTDASAASPLPHGAHFGWPVHGRVLTGYGVTANGSRNDGINIAAARGSPVTAIDAGTVAYAGNELRGYGNLVLIKHASGWISAYAHCEELLVKRGDRVNRGQEIAKVGATGGVSEPQLHFELRRGKRAVDPQEFLSPAPSAGLPAHQG